MTTQTHMIRRHVSTMDSPLSYANITLPATPGIDMTAVRRETEPTLPPIRVHRRAGPLRGAALENRNNMLERQIVAVIAEATQGGEVFQ